ncbi:hypothetical protein NBRC3299_0329 [Acetobacter pasteurianus NBRC 3299]|nr:hypothetical protein BBA71_06555 [Acetobacter pasteurianus]GCD74037.1 hypothetical protein NBRC3299_0329 [Acetobacter pasteurianus NBRC 3299]
MINTLKLSFRSALLGVMGAAAVVAGTAAQAQTVSTAGNGAPNLTPEQVATLQHDMDTALHYHLAPNVLPRLTTALKEIQAAGIQPPSRFGMSLDQQIALVQQVPGLDPILQKNGFSAHDFVMSLTCVGLTGSLMNVPANPGNTKMPQPEPANVAILKSNPQDLQNLVTVLRSVHQSGGALSH